MRRFAYLICVIVLAILLQDVLSAEGCAQEDPYGLRFVKDVLEYKGVRRHRIRKTNDAEQLFIHAVELMEEENYEMAFKYSLQDKKKNSLLEKILNP